MLRKLAYNHETKRIEVEIDVSSLEYEDEESFCLTESEALKAYLSTCYTGDIFTDSIIKTLIEIS